MFIDTNAITVLIEKYEGLGHMIIHPNAIIKDLEGLIDQEAAHLDKMADDYADEEYGRLERENAAIEKELEVDFNWPHAV